MLHIGRPLTLLALAVCTYLVLTWSYRSTTTRVSTRPDYIYDENGFRIPSSPQQQEQVHTRPAPVKPHAEGAGEAAVVVVTTSSAGAASTAGLNSSNGGAATKVQKPAKTYTATSDLPMSTLPYDQQQAYMQDMLHWNRPGHVDGHWPDYEAFEHQDYDPNRWEGFEMYVTETL